MEASLRAQLLAVLQPKQRAADRAGATEREPSDLLAGLAGERAGMLARMLGDIPTLDHAAIRRTLEGARHAKPLLGFRRLGDPQVAGGGLSSRPQRRSRHRADLAADKVAGNAAGQFPGDALAQLREAWRRQQFGETARDTFQQDLLEAAVLLLHLHDSRAGDARTVDERNLLDARGVACAPRGLVRPFLDVAAADREAGVAALLDLRPVDRIQHFDADIHRLGVVVVDDLGHLAGEVLRVVHRADVPEALAHCGLGVAVAPFLELGLGREIIHYLLGLIRLLDRRPSPHQTLFLVRLGQRQEEGELRHRWTSITDGSGRVAANRYARGHLRFPVDDRLSEVERDLLRRGQRLGDPFLQLDLVRVLHQPFGDRGVDIALGEALLGHFHRGPGQQVGGVVGGDFGRGALVVLVQFENRLDHLVRRDLHQVSDEIGLLDLVVLDVVVGLADLLLALLAVPLARAAGLVVLHCRGATAAIGPGHAAQAASCAAATEHRSGLQVGCATLWPGCARPRTRAFATGLPRHRLAVADPAAAAGAAATVRNGALDRTVRIGLAAVQLRASVGRGVAGQRIHHVAGLHALGVDPLAG